MAIQSGRQDPAAAWRHLDVTLLMTVLAVAGYGIVMVWSATRDKLAANGSDPSYYLKRQIVFVVIGLALLVLTASIDYRVFRDFAPIGYVGTIFVLLAVLSPIGSKSKGAQAWFQLGSYQLQPSEIAKVVLIVCLASYCAVHRGDLDGRRLLVVLALALLPMALIYKQPDLGTDLVFVAILICMMLVAGARPRHMALLSALGVIGVVAVLQLGVLKHYQVDRLSAFLNSQTDVQGSTYNLNQSKIAIGAGGITGKGLFKGTQTNLSYVPEQHTDFIFTAVGEQLGLVGSIALLALFALMVWRTWRISTIAKDLAGTLICVGILAMLVFQMFENMGMTMGIMPITGIPLPFMSYGGSATLSEFAAIGLVLNVHMRRFS